MRIFISGGCKNGKSTFAQWLAKQQQNDFLYYIATMTAADNEDNERIERHQKEREGLGFLTIEQPKNIENILEKCSANGSFLLDSLTALLANEMFGANGVYEVSACERVANGLSTILSNIQNIVIVSDYIYSDAMLYDPVTETYRKSLASLDQLVAKCCDVVLEAAYTRIIVHKGFDIFKNAFKELSYKEEMIDNCTFSQQKVHKSGTQAFDLPDLQNLQKVCKAGQTFSPVHEEKLESSKIIKYIKSFYMALGMFSAIPLPFHIWDERLTAVMIASFPLIGAIVGLIWWSVASCLTIPNLHIMPISAIITVTPFFVTGFIHLDGYMDTCDARLSRLPLKDKLRILKDSNVGAFAVVMLVILFLLQFSSVYAIVDSGKHLLLFVAICVISRGCSAFSIFILKHLPKSNYAALLGRNVNKRHKIFVSITIISAVAVSFIYAGLVGLIVSFAVVLAYTLSMLIAYKDFKGVSGDLLGYSLVIGELCGLIAFALL